ncbi:hypothetical protein [Ruegeria sp. PrR005]|uniref:Sulfotransferase family protein n=1 Tax=Ruegeria sp. PrR005 TaxID=2706882 RepID=A0A6B2NQZ8_9RHOB|nr:hypothetical protein [Ruegeria sp. PrR005]NDW44275.1 hypothetical protein [Ruegeria sp. PrR005]
MKKSKAIKKALPAKKQKRATAKSRHCVLVLGMHRSGTSALTGFLQHIGFDMPNTPMAANEGNQRGYFESQKIYEMHRDLLRDAGTTWDYWTPQDPGWLSPEQAAHYRDRAKALIAEEFGASRCFAIKDPRLCRLAPFWIETLTSLKIRPLILHTHRNPVEVAQSLKKRNGFELQFGFLLWLRYVLDAEYSTRGQTRYFTSYEQLLEDWPGVAEGIMSSFHMPLPPISRHVSDEIDEFLSPSLRHFQSGSGSVHDGLQVPVWVQDVYDLLESWARTGESAKDYSRLDKIRTEFDHAGPAFETLVKEGLSVQNQLAKLDETKKQLQDSQAAVATIEAKLKEQSAQHAAAQHQLSTLEQQRLRLEIQLEERKNVLQTVLTKNDSTHSRLGGMQKQLEEGRAIIAALETSVKEHGTRRGEAENRLEDLQKQLQDNREALATLKAASALEQQKHARAEEKITETQARLRIEEDLRLSMEQTLQQTRDTLMQTKSALSQRSLEAEQTAGELDRARKEAAAQQEEHKQNLLSAQKEIEALVLDLEEAQASNSNLKKQLEDRFEELGNLTRKFHESEEQYRTVLEAQQHSHSQKMLQAQKAFQIKAIDLESAQADNAVLSAQVKERFEELGQLTQMLGAAKENYDAKLKAQTHTHRRDVLRMGKSLQARDLDLEEAQTDNRNLKKQLEDRFEELGMLTNMIQELQKSHRTTLDAQRQSHKRDILKVQKALQSTSFDLDKSQADNEALSAKINEANTEIKHLDSAHRKALEALADQDIQINQNAAQAEALMQQLASSQSELTVLQKTLQKKEEETAQILQQKEAQVTQALDDYNAILNSTSWKITAPVRRLMMFLRRSPRN